MNKQTKMTTKLWWMFSTENLKKNIHKQNMKRKKQKKKREIFVLYSEKCFSLLNPTFFVLHILTEPLTWRASSCTLLGYVWVSNVMRLNFSASSTYNMCIVQVANKKKCVHCIFTLFFFIRVCVKKVVKEKTLYTLGNVTKLKWGSKTCNCFASSWINTSKIL